MKAKAIIYSIFAGIGYALVLGGIFWILLFALALALAFMLEFKTFAQMLISSWNAYFVLSIISYLLGIYISYLNQKKRKHLP